MNKILFLTIGLQIHKFWTVSNRITLDISDLDKIRDPDMVGNGCPMTGSTDGNTDVHAGIIVAT